MHQIGEPADILRPGRLTPLQRAELVKVNRVRTFGLKVSVQEVCVADFVNGVAGDVLRAVAIEIGQGDLIIVHWLVRVYFHRRVVADSAEFRVLYPQITFNQFRCGEEAKDGDVSLRRALTAFLCERGLFSAEKSSADRDRACRQSSLLQKGAPI